MLSANDWGNMFDLTVKGYFEAIQSLPLDDFIIFYLTAYFFVKSIQRALGMEIALPGDAIKLETNPKVAASLILAYIFGVTRDLVPLEAFFPNPYLEIIIQAMLLVICVWIFRVLVFSQTGAFQKLFLWEITSKAKKEVEKRTKDPNITTTYEADEKRIQEKSKENQKSLLVQQHDFTINLGASIILLCYVGQLSYLVGILFLPFAGYFLHPYYVAAKGNISQGSQYTKESET